MAALPLAKISERLADGFLNQLEENVNPMTSVIEEVKNISEKLTTIGGLMSDAERRKLKEEEVRIWLQKLDGIACEIDDLLDEWNLEIQKLCTQTTWEKAIYDELEVIWNEAAQFKFVKSHLATCEKPGGILCDELEAFGQESDRDVIVSRLVSESSNKRDVGVLVISVVGKCSPNVSELDSLLQYLRSTLSRKKFLLVLDGVCIQDEIKWVKIRDSLKDGVSGSRILVTTRSERVARLMGTTYMHHLKQMPDSDCWEILSRRAFQGRTKEIFEKVEQIGKGIAKKCNGSPLAAKIVGSLLQCKDTVRDWQNILDNQIWELEEVPVDLELFPALYLTYHELSPELKCCIRYCAVFQKNLRIDVEGLIRLWMAQGYILYSSEADEVQMEERGREYFTLLAGRCFFQEQEKDILDRKVVSCKIHDIVHDFAKHLAKNECLIVEEAHLRENTGAIKHLRWPRDNSRETLSSLDLDVGKVRSFFATTSVPQDCFIKHLKCARTLSFSACSLAEIPSEIGDLIHLRLYEFPRGIEKMTWLRTLTIVKIGTVYFNWSSLKNLNQLQEFMHIQIFDMVGTANAKLEEKQHLKNMILEFSMSCSGLDIDERESLIPPPNLKKLTIRKYPGYLFPNWMETALNNLRVLHIIEAYDVLSLPALGKLPALEELKFVELQSLAYIGREFLGLPENIDSLGESKVVAFTRLKILVFSHLPNWQTWQDIEPGEEDAVLVLPCLQHLALFGCEEFFFLPHRMLRMSSSLQSVELTMSQSVGTINNPYDMGHMIEVLNQLNKRFDALESKVEQSGPSKSTTKRKPHLDESSDSNNEADSEGHEDRTRGAKRNSKHGDDDEI
nr:putative disease resistance protein RGA4 [Coffea arabica]